MTMKKVINAFLALLVVAGAIMFLVSYWRDMSSPSSGSLTAYSSSSYSSGSSSSSTTEKTSSTTNSGQSEQNSTSSAQSTTSSKAAEAPKVSSSTTSSSAGAGSSSTTTKKEETPKPIETKPAETKKEFDVYSVPLHSVDSSCFSEIGYDSEWETLVVRFRENNSYLYAYGNFSQSDYNQFKNASSLGTYYNTYIKGQYPSTKY